VYLIRWVKSLKNALGGRKGVPPASEPSVHKKTLDRRRKRPAEGSMVEESWFERKRKIGKNGFVCRICDWQANQKNVKIGKKYAIKRAKRTKKKATKTKLKNKRSLVCHSFHFWCLCWSRATLALHMFVLV
jgi:hypothetical protein